MTMPRNCHNELRRRGIDACDYIVSGIPFSILKIDKKRELLRKTHDALAPGGRFIIYQVTNELKQHATLFDRAESEYVLQNIPPMFITVFEKTSSLNGHPPSGDGSGRHSGKSTRMTGGGMRMERDSMGEMSVPRVGALRCFDSASSAEFSD